MAIFPDWRGSLDTPTVGDDVRISHVITVNANTEWKNTFQVSVQPRSGNGVLSERARALAALLMSTHEGTNRFMARYLGSSIDAAELDDLRVNLKNLLENYRSALEYTAHYLADMCTPKPAPDKVKFPVAKPSDTAATFENSLDKWFPGLGTNKPAVRDHLVSIQVFNGDTWLRELADLTNFNKHHSLSEQELACFPSVVVGFGNVGLRLGEMGLKSVSLDAGGVLRFLDTAGEHADLKGPCVLSAETTSIPTADHPIELVCERLQLYRVPGYTESIPGTLWRINKNVFRTVNRICGLLS